MLPRRCLPLLIATALALLPVARASAVGFDFVVLASSLRAVVPAIEIPPSIDDTGEVAFAGSAAGSQWVLVADEPGAEVLADYLVIDGDPALSFNPLSGNVLGSFTDGWVAYRTQDFLAEVQAATGGKGVDVILDMVGGDYVPKELKCLADDGRLVFIAFLRGPKAELNIVELMQRRLTLSGSTLRPRTVQFKGSIAASLRERIWPLIDAGKIRPEIYKTFPLEQAAEAHRLMESSEHIGKIVLTV